MNSAFNELMRMDNFNCVIFHDVDMLPEDDRNRYACGSNPIHLSLMINKYKYRYPYGTDFGGNFFKYFIYKDKLYVLKFWSIFIRGSSGVSTIIGYPNLGAKF